MIKKLATITILSDDRHVNATAIQKIMTANSRLIHARLGVNLVPACSAQCTGIIVVIVEGNSVDIKGLTAAFNKIKSVRAKSLTISQ
jgi:metal-responsive CopG/Arc/MetJ family transcriptional regulator